MSIGTIAPLLQWMFLFLPVFMIGVVVIGFSIRNRKGPGQPEKLLYEEDGIRVRIKKRDRVEILENCHIRFTSSRLAILPKTNEHSPLHLVYGPVPEEVENDYRILPSMMEALSPPGPRGLLIPVASEVGKSFMSVFLETDVPNLYLEKVGKTVLRKVA